MSIKLFGFVLKPEIEKPLYWLHLGVIAIVVLGVLQLWKGGEMLTVTNVLYSIPLIGLGDILSHSLLNLD
jgi:hypothetical protein